MSVQSMARVLDEFPVGGTQKLVMLGIANHDGDGGSWPTVATLARYACVSERAVQASLAELERDGWLRRHRNEGGDRSAAANRRPNLYEILWDRFELSTGVPPTAPQTGVKPAAPQGSRGEESRRSGVKPASPKPSFNHPSVETTRARAPHDGPLQPVENADQHLDVVRRLRAEHRLPGAPVVSS